MKKTLDVNDFINEFRDAGRLDDFSIKGLEVLFEYFEEVEQDSDTEFEIDVIALCCDYTEDTIENTLRDYNLESIEELEENTTVLYVDEETIIYQNF